MSNRVVIHGIVPAKSNCYVIIKLRSKDPNKKEHYSLARSSQLKKYIQDFAYQYGPHKQPTIEGPFQFQMTVYYANERADLDNSLKVVLDCLQEAKAFHNDNKCEEITVKKRIDKINPRIEFSILPLSAQPSNAPPQGDLFKPEPKPESWV